MRLFATSDLHVDFQENQRFIQGLSQVDFVDDALLVAGDVAHRLSVVREALVLLKRKFSKVFFVPGNHELWVRGEAGDSIDKFWKLLAVCEEVGVCTQPGKAGRNWIVPLFSWYDVSFADPREKGGLDGWSDFYHCRWPVDLGGSSRFFSALNEPHLQPCRDGKIISFSHFLPRPELLPDPAYLRFRGLLRVAGSAAIERQVRALGAAVHVFGHSHIRRDLVLDQVRYVQHSLGYPRERRGRGFALMQLD